MISVIFSGLYNRFHFFGLTKNYLKKVRLVAVQINYYIDKLFTIKIHNSN